MFCNFLFHLLPSHRWACLSLFLHWMGWWATLFLSLLFWLSVKHQESFPSPLKGGSSLLFYTFLYSTGSIGQWLWKMWPPEQNTQKIIYDSIGAFWTLGFFSGISFMLLLFFLNPCYKHSTRRKVNNTPTHCFFVQNIWQYNMAVVWNLALSKQ